jgi:hypothetical protein
MAAELNELRQFKTVALCMGQFTAGPSACS